jgi:alpha-L-fucosidase
MKAQLKELLTNYGEIGIAWFDGEWEPAWTHERGLDLYDYMRGLQPSIIVNNRVDKGRKGMAGLTKEGGFAGDYGTPEQEIPPKGVPGLDWESCMTMNDTWGYSSRDQNWKSTEKLVRNLIDIASKGGNYLLNVGPTAEGEIPGPSIERLQAIGEWMKVNGESIHETSANPFDKTPWGRCTTRKVGDNTRIYLHIFDWPADGKLRIDGLKNKVLSAKLLAAPDAELTCKADGETVTVTLPGKAPDPIASVLALDCSGSRSEAETD